MRSRTLLATTVACVLAVLPLSACTGDQGESASDGANAVATALSTGKLTAARFVPPKGTPAQQWWTDATDGMDGSRVKVTAGDVTEGEKDTASVKLTYAWKLAGGHRTWTEHTTAHLVRGEDDRWRARVEPGLLGLRPGERLALSTTTADRAPILGAGGTEIVTDRPVLRFGVDKAQVPIAQAPAVARRLAAIVGVDAADLEKRVRDAAPKAFVEAIVLRKQDAGRQLAQAGGVRGIGVLEDTMPLAPTREFARPILGTVGPVTAEIVQKSKGAYSAGDEAGLSGLQQRYDARLRGTPGVTVSAVNGSDKRVLHETDPVPGKPLATTLDVPLQEAAERALASVRPASALVAIRPSTGDILAAASGPGSNGYNTATVGRYAPGSTFKVVSSLALLRAGLTPNSPVSCPATTVVDGKTFKNYDDYPSSALGRITLRRAVANSCNTAFIGERDRARDLAGAAAALGLGVDHDLGFPAYFGSVPDPTSETSRAASLIGQGQVLASPMAMAAVIASVENGATVVPRLLPDQKPDGHAPADPLTAAEARTLRGLLRAVVTEGSGSGLADLPGPPVIAKTGTAEFGDKQPLQTHAWMVAAQGDLAVAVFVDVGESGSRTAGPVLEQFLRSAR